MKVEGELFGNRKGINRREERRQKRAMGMNMIRVQYIHI
jgi:hypothetical protein